MTRDQIQNVHDDIAYMRAMAHEGRNAPLLSGPVMVVAGIVFSLASLVHWTIVAGLVNVSSWAQLWVWVTAAVIFTIGLVVVLRRQAHRPGAGSAGNRASNAAWSGVGYGIFASWVALMAAGMTTGDWALMRVMPIIVVVAYGSAWFVAGAMARLRWMKGVALLSYAGAAVLGAFIDSPTVLLVYAALLVLVALLPGLALMRQEPAEVV